MCYSSDEEEEGLSSWKKKDVERKKELERKTKEMEERFVCESLIHLHIYCHVVSLVFLLIIFPTRFAK